MPTPRRRAPAERRVLNPSEPDQLLQFQFDGGSDYETDTRVTQALDALIPEGELRHPDQRFFQLVHLSTEYAWVGAHHEMVRAAHAIDAGASADAVRLLSRATDLADVSVGLVRTMQDSFPQSSFLLLRDGFPQQTTGLDSPGMRNMRRAARGVWASVEAALDRAGLTLLDVRRAELARSSQPQRGSGRMAEAGRSLESVLFAAHRLDARVLEWKRAHIALVWMILGGLPVEGTSSESACPVGADDFDDEDLDDEAAQVVGGMPTSLRGRPVSDLERLAVRPLFPALWHSSTEMFQAVVGDADV